MIARIGTFVLDTWRDALPVTVRAADEVGRPRTHAPADPPEPSDFHVLMHGLRHLLGRAQPTIMEVKLLLGLARQLQWFAEHKSAGDSESSMGREPPANDWEN